MPNGVPGSVVEVSADGVWGDGWVWAEEDWVFVGGECLIGLALTMGCTHCYEYSRLRLVVLLLANCMVGCSASGWQQEKKSV